MINLPNLTASAKDVLAQLFIKGPTWDGDITSKQGRLELVIAGYAARFEGFTFLTKEGVKLCLVYKFDKIKEGRNAEVSKALHYYRHREVFKNEQDY